MYIDQSEDAAEISYNDSLQSPTSGAADVQAAIDWLKTQIGLGASGYQQYQTALNTIYTIPVGISSVVTGPFMNYGSLIVLGRLQII